jgi:hypothetical protein
MDDFSAAVAQHDFPHSLGKEKCTSQIGFDYSAPIQEAHFLDGRTQR